MFVCLNFDDKKHQYFLTKTYLYVVAGTLGHLFIYLFFGGGSENSYVILRRVMPNAYVWWQGGGEGGQKSPKHAYVIHGCSLTTSIKIWPWLTKNKIGIFIGNFDNRFLTKRFLSCSKKLLWCTLTFLKKVGKKWIKFIMVILTGNAELSAIWTLFIKRANYAIINKLFYHKWFCFWLYVLQSQTPLLLYKLWVTQIWTYVNRQCNLANSNM